LQHRFGTLRHGVNAFPVTCNSRQQGALQKVEILGGHGIRQRSAGG